MLQPMETYTVLSTTSFPHGYIYHLSTRRKHICSHPTHSQPHAKLWIHFFWGPFQFSLEHLHHSYGLPKQYYCHQIFSHQPIFSSSYLQNCLKMGQCFSCNRRIVFQTDLSKTCMGSPDQVWAHNQSTAQLPHQNLRHILIAITIMKMSRSTPCGRSGLGRWQLLNPPEDDHIITGNKYEDLEVHSNWLDWTW